METTVIITVIAIVVGVPLMVVAIVYLIVPFFRLIGRIFGNIYRFVRDTIADLLRSTAHLLTAIVFTVAWLGALTIARKPAAAHFLEATHQELMQLGAGLYRLVIGNPARLFGADALAEGLEQRVPQVFEQAPATEADAMARKGQFEGYTIVGTLQGGGSGGKLYIAKPDAIKLAALARLSAEPIDQVVIKSFSVYEGSSLPQIVRESRALEAARKLGLVLDHELTGERFYYVMRYVPGELLGVVTQRLHATGEPGGLGGDQLAQAISIGCDLLATLDQYHRAGLWHKDIKPDNIIVSTHDARTNVPARAQLVDFGLVTPLRSSMTLTTHGTEYFRDPEMVRMALRGVKVQDVDGAKFDIYGAGAVMFSIIENSFPAHGGLSQLTKRCPDCVRWIVRRAMTDYSKRYSSAALMLADLRAVQRALAEGTLEALTPAQLPSAKLGLADSSDEERDDRMEMDPSAGATAPTVEAEEPVDLVGAERGPEAVIASAPASAQAPRVDEPIGESLHAQRAKRKVAVFTGTAPASEVEAIARERAEQSSASASVDAGSARAPVGTVTPVVESPAERWRRTMRVPVLMVSIVLVLLLLGKLIAGSPSGPRTPVARSGSGEVPEVAPAPALEPVRIALEASPEPSSLSVLGQRWMERMKGQMSSDQLGSIQDTIASVEKTVEMMRQAKAQQQATTNEQLRQNIERAEQLEKALREMFRDPASPEEPVRAPATAKAEPKKPASSKPPASERVRSARMLVVCDEGVDVPKLEATLTRARAMGFVVMSERAVQGDKSSAGREAIELSAALRERMKDVEYGGEAWKSAVEQWQSEVPLGQLPALVVWYQRVGDPPRMSATIVPTRTCDAKTLRLGKSLLSRVE